MLEEQSLMEVNYEPLSVPNTLYHNESYLYKGFA